jgi:hypothetical protein
MKVRIEVGELVLDGLPEDQGRVFARHLEEEVGRLVEGGAPIGESSIDEVRLERTRPVTSAGEAAADVARAISRGMRP